MFIFRNIFANKYLLKMVVNGNFFQNKVNYYIGEGGAQAVEALRFNMIAKKDDAALCSSNVSSSLTMYYYSATFL